MATLDLSLNPYERFVNTTQERIYHNYFYCICKDELLECLSKIPLVENIEKYNCYIWGKINSSSSYPTWDCDLFLTSSIIENREEIFTILNNIKNIGLEKNLNFDLKYIKDINIINSLFDNPDDLSIVNYGIFGYDISNNNFGYVDISRNIIIRKSRNKEWTYYKPLLLKKENFTTLEQSALDFINNSNLPDSSERANPFAIRRHYIYNQDTKTIETTYL